MATLLASTLSAGAADGLPAAAGASTPAAAGSGAHATNVELVKPGLYRIDGAAGRALVRVGSKGVVVVDPTGSITYPLLLAQIEAITKTSEPAVRALVLTAGGLNQSERVGEFVAAGVPVIIQRGALDRLARDGKSTWTSASRSFITYETDYQLHVGEVTVESEHVGSGRTGADSIVVFPGLGVVAVGELFTTGSPEPDCASGGSFAGWAAAIDHLLWSDFDIAVPSRGAPVGKPELTAFKATLEALARRASSSPSAVPGCGPTLK